MEGERHQTGAFGLAGADTIWISVGASIGAGEVARFELRCDEPVTANAELYAVPPAPVTYSGATTPGSSRSELPFNAVKDTSYALNLTLTSGAVRLSEQGARRQTFPSSGTYLLDSKFPGYNVVYLEAVEGPPATWTVTIAPLPVKLTAVRFKPRKILPGAITRLRYVTSGSTLITAEIVAPGGRVVRQLASQLPVGRGAHVLPWNGKRINGSAGRPGTYVARITSQDNSGQSTTATARVRVMRPKLTARGAKRVAHRLWKRVVGDSYTYGLVRRNSCGRKLSRVSRKCRSSWAIGDSSSKATARIRLSIDAKGRKRYHARYLIRQLDTYCFYVQDRPKAACLNKRRGRAVLR